MTTASKPPILTRPTEAHLELASKACEFLTASTDPFHAVQTASSLLKAGGFVELNPKAPLQPQMEASKNANKFYYKVHHSTLVSFCVGHKYRPGNGFHVIGGHTDSPNLRVKPKSRRPAKGGVVQLGVECYGGGLWHTWFDRDLSLSGKVLVRGSGTDDDSAVTSKLVQFRDPFARVSNLAIHLQSADERVAFKVNKEDHTVPVIAMEDVSSSKTKDGGDNAAATQLEKEAEAQLTDWHDGHEPLLLRRIADELKVDVGQIADVDLSLYDTQPAALGGMHKEFLYSGRLDNLATVFCSVEALVSHANEHLVDDENVSVVVCFDHEEVGSVSSHGAGSPVLQTAIDRIATALAGMSGGAEANNNSTETRAVTLQNSFILSVDQAHAIHPNYAGKHEPQHAPMLNRGVVIKTNSNQRYTTNSLTGFVVRELGRKAGVPMQEFCVRNDCPCGSTIGPTISALTGIRTVDLGMPQWSMHSCREVMGTIDLTHGVNLFKTFFQSFKQINDSLQD